MSEIDELIRRLEEASEGCGRLDAEVAVALRIGTDALPDWAFVNFPKWRPRNDGRVEVVHGDGRAGVHWKPPPFTTSLDAALTLVPDGKWWLIVAGKSDPDEPLYSAIVVEPDDGEAIIGEGKSDAGPALALCIAALRAREEIA